MDTLVTLIVIAVVLYFIFRKKKPKQELKKSYQSKSNNSSAIDANVTFSYSESKIKYYLFFDVETTGLPKKRYAPVNDFDNWPHPIQIAWMIFDKHGKVIKERVEYIKQNINIPFDAVKIHGITNVKIEKEGVKPHEIYSEFLSDLDDIKMVVAHNIEFDANVLNCDLLRNGFKTLINDDTLFCTMKYSVKYCKLSKSSGGFKYPKLEELYSIVFYNNQHLKIEGTHDAKVDTFLTAKCYFELRDRGVFSTY